jgi:hypothetical protein
MVGLHAFGPVTDKWLPAFEKFKIRHHASSRSPVNEHEAGIRSPIQTIAHLGEVSCTNYNRLFLFLEPVDFLNRGR